MLPDIYNISGSHGDEQITLLAVGEQIILNLIKGREILAGSSQFLNTLLQIFRRNSQSIGFSCCINIRNYHMICQAECFGKLRKQSFGMLYRMYTRYADRNGFSVEVLDMLDGDEAGIKSVTFQVNGENAYGYLKSEKGVHRLVRISPFNAAGKRQTSFVSCDVMPEIEEDLDVEINDDDLRKIA